MGMAAGVSAKSVRAMKEAAKRKRLKSKGVVGEKGNRREDLNCVPEGTGSGVGAGVSLVKTADPADRAHGVMAVEADGISRYVPAAVRERRGTRERRKSEVPPAWHATKNLPAKPRRYHISNMAGTRIDLRGVAGPVSLDSAADDLYERADRIKQELGIDLLRGGDTQSGRVEDMSRCIRLRDLVEKGRRGRPDEHELAVRRFLAHAHKQQPHIKMATLERWGENPARLTSTLDEIAPPPSRPGTRQGRSDPSITPHDAHRGAPQSTVL